MNDNILAIAYELRKNTENIDLQKSCKKVHDFSRGMNC